MSDLDNPAGAQSGTEPNGTQSGTGSSSDANNTGGTDTGAQSGATPPAETVSRADFDRLRAQLQAADQKRTEAESKYTQLVDKDLPAQEKLTRDLQAATERATVLEGEVKKLRVDNAFLKDNTHKWQDAGTALQLLDMSAVEIDSEGTVTGLKEALAKLAKEKPFLISSESVAQDDAPAGGTVPGTNGKPGTDTPQRKALESRFGQLRTRR